MYRPDGSLAEQVVFNRERSRIVSEYNEAGGGDDWDERHTVITPDGSKFTFETSGDTQTVYDANGEQLSQTVWTEHGPEAQPIVQLARARVPRGSLPRDAQVGTEFQGGLKEALTAAAAALFTWLSARNDHDGTSVFAFRAAQYRKQETSPENFDAVWVGRLTQERVNKVCDQLGDVQE